MIKGEPMPDKNDPKYRERYERDFAAGGKFAKAVGINWLAVQLYKWANSHRVLFLVIVFGTVLFLLGMNIVGMVRHYKAVQEHGRHTAVEMVDQALKEKRNQNR